MKRLLNFASRVLALYACVYLMGIQVNSIWDSMIFVIALSVLYFLIKPLLMILTVPINFLTFGLFTFVINTLIVLLTDWLIEGVHIGGFWEALIFSIIYSAIVLIIKLFYNDK